MNSSPLKSQVVSLDLSKRLKKLGVKQESIFYWDEGDGIEDRLEYSPNKCIPELYSAFLVGELISILQDVAEDDIVVSINDKTPADTLAEMLCTKLQSSKGNVGSGRTL